MTSNRDLTKYEFEGKILGKGRLVLALVRRYVLDHSPVKFEQLHAAFPDKLQADNPIQFHKVRCVVSRLSDLTEASRDRFFSAEEDGIHLGDDMVVVSREWNLHNIQNVLALAKGLGYQITVEPRISRDAEDAED